MLCSGLWLRVISLLIFFYLYGGKYLVKNSHVVLLWLTIIALNGRIYMQMFASQIKHISLPWFNTPKKAITWRIKQITVCKKKSILTLSLTCAIEILSCITSTDITEDDLFNTNRQTHTHTSRHTELQCQHISQWKVVIPKQPLREITVVSEDTSCFFRIPSISWLRVRLKYFLNVLLPAVINITNIPHPRIKPHSEALGKSSLHWSACCTVTQLFKSLDPAACFYMIICSPDKYSLSF